MKSLKSIKILVILITALSLLSGIINKIFPSLLALPNLSSLLGLQLDSLASLKIWQFLTHLFIYPAYDGIHIFYLLHLFIGLTLLQRMGTIIAFHKGEKSFLKFFLTCGIISGIAAFFTISYFQTPHLYAGPTSAIYGLLIASTFLFPKLDFMMAFTSPVKGKILFPGIIGLILLMNLSIGDYTHFFATITSCITAYIYVLLFWKIESPYIFMQKFDKWVIGLSSGKLVTLFNSSSNLEKYTKNSRIYDIKTGKAIFSEESFINACLEKISKEGKNSLTWYEKFKLQRYSKKIAKKASK